MSVHHLDSVNSMFVATSYAWGDETDLVPMVVDSKTFWITRNGYEALERARDRDPRTLYWIEYVILRQSLTSVLQSFVRYLSSIVQSASTKMILRRKVTKCEI